MQKGYHHHASDVVLIASPVNPDLIEVWRDGYYVKTVDRIPYLGLMLETNQKRIKQELKTDINLLDDTLQPVDINPDDYELKEQ